MGKRTYADWQIHEILNALSEQAHNHARKVNLTRAEKGEPPLSDAFTLSSAWKAIEIIEQLQEQNTKLIKELSRKEDALNEAHLKLAELSVDGVSAPSPQHLESTSLPKRKRKSKPEIEDGKDSTAKSN